MLPGGGVGIRVGSPVEDRPGFAWMTWPEWQRLMGRRGGTGGTG
jgi:hypothetical protein